MLNGFMVPVLPKYYLSLVVLSLELLLSAFPFLSRSLLAPDFSNRNRRNRNLEAGSPGSSLPAGAGHRPVCCTGHGCAPKLVPASP